MLTLCGTKLLQVACKPITSRKQVEQASMCSQCYLTSLLILLKSYFERHE